MMTDEGKVAAINVVQVTEVTSSNAMEKEGFERCIQDLAREEVTIKRIATDRHTSISSSMKVRLVRPRCFVFTMPCNASPKNTCFVDGLV